jgi:hypothetical protein
MRHYLGILLLRLLLMPAVALLAFLAAIGSLLA